MDRNGIKAHWQDWAKTYGTSLRATTKTSTAKAMECDALARAFRRVLGETPTSGRILEVGCGNGENCLFLAQNFPNLLFTGIDFISDMVEAAKIRRNELGLPESRLRFQTGDLLDPDLQIEDGFDLIYTDRCLINLGSDEAVCRALSRLCGKLAVGSHLLLIENCTETHAMQNGAREALGLPPRAPASFNYFLKESVILPHLETSCDMEILAIEDFISLHDLILYVLVPALNGGTVDYEHPLVELATTLNIALNNERPNAFGTFGQNRLYLCRKAS